MVLRLASEKRSANPKPKKKAKSAAKPKALAAGEEGS